jgi:phenylacetic acid degradation protein
VAKADYPESTMDQPPRTGPALGPTIHPSAVLAPGAIVIGQVTIEADCFIGPNAVLRGDIDPIVVRRGSNVQDNCTVHTERGSPVSIGPDASIGHGAVVHGATIGERALVGMNAVVLNGAVVGERAVVGALTLVPNNFVVPPRTLAVGAPCVLKKQGDPGIAEMAFMNTERYHRYREEHLAGRWKTVRGPLNDKGTFASSDRPIH